MTATPIEPAIDNTDCPLCAGTRIIKVIRPGQPDRVTEFDECPYCLKRLYSRLENRLIASIDECLQMRERQLSPS